MVRSAKFSQSLPLFSVSRAIGPRLQTTVFYCSQKSFLIPTTPLLFSNCNNFSYYVLSNLFCPFSFYSAGYDLVDVKLFITLFTAHYFLD